MSVANYAYPITSEIQLLPQVKMLHLQNLSRHAWHSFLINVDIDNPNAGINEKLKGKINICQFCKKKCHLNSCADSHYRYYSNHPASEKVSVNIQPAYKPFFLLLSH